MEWTHEDSFKIIEELLESKNSFDLVESIRETNIPVDFQNKFGLTVLHLACKNARLDSVRELLQAGADPNKSDGLGRRPLHFVLDVGCHCQLCSTLAYKCMNILLNFGANVNVLDKNGESPFRYAAKSLLPNCALELLDHGAEVIFDKTENCIRHLLNERMPEVLVKILDKAIMYDEQDNSKLKLDFGWVFQIPCNGITTPNEAGVFSENSFLVQLAKIEKGREEKPILTHPWVQAFLHLKWLAVRKWFWTIRLIYALFITFYTFFIFHIYILQCPYDKFYSKTSMSNSTGHDGDVQNSDDNDRDDSCKLSTFNCVCGTIGMVCAAIMIKNEFFQVKVDVKAYFTNYLNLFWWVLIICLILTLLPAYGMIPRPWHYPVAAFGLFFTWAMNLTQVSRRPIYGEYIEMLGKVLVNFFTFLITFSSLIVAFGLGMCVMFPENEFFQTIPLGFVKILILMMGEDDYDGLFKENIRVERLEYSIPAHLMYVGFLALVTLVLSNLLLGLAVNDIQELKKKSSIRRITRQIIQISYLESFINSSTVNFLAWLVRPIFRRTTIETTIGRSVTFSPLNPNDKLFPEKLKEKFIPYMTRCPCVGKYKNMHLKTGTHTALNQV